MSGYNYGRQSGGQRKPSDAVTIHLAGLGNVRVMSLRYAGECAGVSGEHDAECPSALEVGARAVFYRDASGVGVIMSLQCADQLAPWRWVGSPVSGRNVTGILGRPIEERGTA